MPNALQHLFGVPVLMCAVDGPIVRIDDEAMDLISEAAHRGARWVILPANRLNDAFFQLKTGVAGAVFQKFVTYRVGLAILGDISRHTIASSAIRDFVHESNQGTGIWLVADIESFGRQLQRLSLASE